MSFWSIIGIIWASTGLVLYYFNRNLVSCGKNFQQVDKNLLILLSCIGLITNGWYGLAFFFVLTLITWKVSAHSDNSDQNNQ